MYTNPEPPIYSEDEEMHINTYSYQLDNISPHQSRNYDKTLNRISDITPIILNDSKRIYDNSNSNTSSHIDISIVYKGSDQICIGAFLTLFSLGIIPSWCTAEDVMSFNFKLYENNRLCKEDEYSIDATQYNHLVTLPFGLGQGLYETGIKGASGVGLLSQSVELYEQALKSFINTGCIN